ncbi:IS66 family transposase [Flavivirga sp. 57AJ16]|uniref:IS66 family transposase n=1 Tax=Flavivirga sp. 57AJ16 TaxID=3025307 RepID=UPI00236587E5|nr:IS66 family transposase [Flavivirga sp. 57AJ16]MDD7888323.1 IS66 family transposase [Flavivirga sp. 57AJ16]
MENLPVEQRVTITKKQHEFFLNQQKEIDLLKHQLAELQRMLFGAKSERFAPASEGQLSLSLDITVSEPQAEEVQDIAYQRKKVKKAPKKIPVRLPIPSHIPRVEIEIYPKEDIKHAKKIGESVTEVLEYKPGTFYVKKYIRYKYVLPLSPEKIVIGELPSLPIPRGNAGASLLAHIMVSKYVDHLPFHRQKKIFARQDIELSESTLNGWFSSSCKLLEPLYNVLREKVKQVDYLMADETPIPVLTKNKPGSAHKGYFWVYYDPLGGTACFDYHPSRGREGPNDFLKNFKGALQTDGYVAYDIYEKDPEVQLLGCLAHARRKLEHALDNDRQRAEYALKLIAELYSVERQARKENLSHQERKALRDKHARPVWDTLKQWMDQELYKVLPDSVIGKAMAYTHKLWPRLVGYLSDGRYEIDNNLVENRIRPTTLGRKNFLFAGSHKGAQRAAMMYSFLGSCKKNDVNPFAWLADVLARIPECKVSQLDELLPENWNPRQ